MDDHTAAVARIASQVKRLYEQKKPFKIYHGTTNSTRKIVVDRSSVLDINSLSHVLDLNVSTRTALVEPNVSMAHLASLTLPYGLLPAVVPEFPAITLGGAVAGTAGESSSFKYGFVSENVNWMELVLANGQITKASADDNPELFDGVAGTFGSVAIMTLLEIRLVKAKDHVSLTHTPVNSVRELLWRIKKETENEAIDFVDAIMYKRNRGVVITGRFAEVIPTSKQLQRYARAKDEWYYLHIRNILDKASSTWIETVPTADYLFRYDRGAFWAGRYVFTYFGIPFIRLFRWALDPLLHTKVLYHGLHENGMAKHNIIQDIILPASRTQDFIYWVDKEFGIYPLWLCPFRRRRRPGGSSSQQLGLHPRSSSLLLHKEEEKEGSTEPPLLISIGLWGPRLQDPQNFVAENRKIERKVQELGGVKWLYAQCHYTEEEFWKVYNREWYEELRRKYSAEYLPSVYDKTKFDWDAEERAIRGYWLRWLFSFVWWIWPLPGVYGVIRVLMRNVNAANISSRDSVIHFAASFDRPELLPLLLDRGADYAALNINDRDLAHTAAQFAGADFISVMARYDIPRLSLDARDNEGKTAKDYMNERVFLTDREIGVHEAFEGLVASLSSHSESESEDSDDPHRLDFDDQTRKSSFPQPPGAFP